MKGAIATAILLALARRSLAHEHHTDSIPEGEAVSPDPIDSILWAHILVQISAWGIIFPTGMVLGIIRSRWHVPVQTAGTLLALLAYFLGHKHGGREFAPNIHATFANSLGFMLALQILIGIYLKLHLSKGFNAAIRPYIVKTHGVIGKLMPVVSWVQMLFGGITAMGYCRGDHLGQCLAHYIMGSAFIGYGIVLTILLLVGQLWLRRTGRSQEFFDSLVIAAWGCVNTFTEHRWGQAWRGNDLQHTSMGIVWWCAGLLGIWLSRKRNGRPKRNLVPGMVIFITGWAMGAHPQHEELSTMVHSFFGYALMAAGVARIVEISFLLRDKRAVSGRWVEEVNSFQYLTPFLLISSGILFMGATEEQIAILAGLRVTHVSYILLIFSAAFLLFLFVCVLLHLYAQATWPLDHEGGSHYNAGMGGGVGGKARGKGGIKLPDTPVDAKRKRAEREREVDLERAREVEEFELEGLMSEEEEDDDDDAEGFHVGGGYVNGLGEGGSKGGGGGGSGGGNEDLGSGTRKEELFGV